MSYSTEVLADSPLAYWKLDETSGTTAADSSGNSRDATYTNSPTVGATSLLSDGTGHSMGLTANSSQCTAIASAAWMNTTDITAECIAKITSAVDASNGDALISRWASFNWRIYRSAGGFAAADLSNAAGGTKTIISTTTLTTGVTYHLVMTKTNTTMKLFVNGVEVADLASGVGLGSGSSAAGSPGSGIWSSASAIQLGRDGSNANSVPAGNLDEGAVYDHDIGSTRVAAHYAAATAPPTISGSFSATLPVPGATFTGFYATGTFAATLTAPTASFSGTYSGIVTGSFSATLPVPTVDFTGGYTPPAISGSFDATLPVLTASFTGTPPFEIGSLDAVLPLPVVSFAGSYGGPYPTDTSNSANGRRRFGSATVTVTRPVVAPPATTILAAKYDKARALPVPTMVDGRPT